MASRHKVKVVRGMAAQWQSNTTIVTHSESKSRAEQSGAELGYSGRGIAEHIKEGDARIQ